MVKKDVHTKKDLEGQSEDALFALKFEFDDPGSHFLTELLCNKEAIHDYIEQTDDQAHKGAGHARSFFAWIWDIISCKSYQEHRERNKPHYSPDSDNWHVCARWVKFFEILENEGKRWSKPHVTTLCPYYIQQLRDNLELVKDLPGYERPDRKKEEDDEVYQAIYLCDSGDEDQPIKVLLHANELKWVVLNGTAHDRFEVGRAIGGVFSCEEYKLTMSEVTLHQIRGIIDVFLHHSTLVPFNSWDPRFRMMPPQIEEDVPKWLDPEMRRSGAHVEHEVGGGLWEDIRFKLKYYVSDWTDAINFQILSSVIFCFFVNITPIVTFGAMTQDDTEGAIGTIESIVGASLCGILWSMTAGQPLIIISQTGPMLIFDRILYQQAQKFGGEIDFLNFRNYVGIWGCILCLLIVVTRSSKLVKYITNFTEECFSCLISLIFIIDGLKKILGSKDIKQWPTCGNLPNAEMFANATYAFRHSNESCHYYNDYDYQTCGNLLAAAESHLLCRPDVPDNTTCNAYEACKSESGYFGMLLSFLTLFLCFLFQGFRTSSIFTTQVRKQLANFGVVLSIGICVLIDQYAGLPTFKLSVPASFTTTTGRDWQIPLQFNLKYFGIALLPAILMTVLVFLDQQITAVIINRKENQLKKGDGYHLDLMVIGLLIPVCTYLGFPLYVAATVRSIAHVQSLKMYEDSTAPGQPPRFVGVLEQRFTGLITFVLVGCSILFSPYLVYIPINILYGVFVFMGINALRDLGIVERIFLLFTPVKHQPDLHYLRKVKLKGVHVYTVIQVACLIALYVIKSIQLTSIFFPVMIVVIVLVRKQLEYVYSAEELRALDH